MKKHIAVTLSLVFISGSAFASKARLEALGEDSDGSQFLSDNRNVFLNAAHINYHKDFVTFEWGDTDQAAPVGGGINADLDAPATPHAEGGVFKASGNMVYGLYFGSESTTSNYLRALAMGANAVAEQNNVDFFVGGDAGVQWGASLTYTSTKDETATGDPEQSAMRARIGVISGDLEGFANIGISNKAESGDAEFEGGGSFDIGATYSRNTMAYMARVQSITAEDAEGDKFKQQNMSIGAAKTYKLNDKASLWIDAFYEMNKTENEFALTPGGATGDEKETALPVGIALEVAAREWLVLRGSVTQEIMGQTENDDGDTSTNLNTTLVRAGASLLFGDLAIDGMIGNMDNTGVVGDSTSDSKGTLRTDALLSRVSLTYRF